jgi:hypothetical protein
MVARFHLAAMLVLPLVSAGTLGGCANPSFHGSAVTSEGYVRIVSVDGRDTQPVSAPWGRVMVEPGPRDITVSYPGGLSETVRVDVQPCMTYYIAANEASKLKDVRFRIDRSEPLSACDPNR